MKTSSFHPIFFKSFLISTGFTLVASLISCTVVHERPGSRNVAIKDVPFASRNQDEDLSTAMKKRLLVLPFLNGSGATAESIPVDARESFLSDLAGSHAAVLVSPNDLKVNLNDYVKDNQYRMDELAKVAGKAGIAAVLEGKLIDVRIKRNADSVGLIRQVKSVIEVVVRVKVISTRNGKELMNKTVTEKTEDSTVRVIEKVDQDRFFQENPELIRGTIASAFRNLVPATMNSLDNLAWEGRVALVQGDRVFLNVGRLSGVQLGDVLKVTEDGEEVFDPETGGPIGKIPGKMKGTLEVVSYFGQDGSVAVIHSGAGFKENDKVELY